MKYLPWKYRIIMHIASPNMKFLSKVVATSENGIHSIDNIISLTARFNRNKLVMVLIFFSLISVRITKTFPMNDSTNIILYKVIFSSAVNAFTDFDLKLFKLWFDKLPLIELQFSKPYRSVQPLSILIFSNPDFVNQKEWTNEPLFLLSIPENEKQILRTFIFAEKNNLIRVNANLDVFIFSIERNVVILSNYRKYQTNKILVEKNASWKTITHWKTTVTKSSHEPSIAKREKSRVIGLVRSPGWKRTAYTDKISLK